MGYSFGMGNRPMFGQQPFQQPQQPWGYGVMQRPQMPQLPMQSMAPQMMPSLPQMPQLPPQAMQGQPDPSGGAFAGGQFMPPGLQGRTDMPTPWANGTFMPPGLQGRTDLPGPFAGGTFNPQGMGQAAPAAPMTMPTQAGRGLNRFGGLLGS